MKHFIILSTVPVNELQLRFHIHVIQDRKIAPAIENEIGCISN